MILRWKGVAQRWVLTGTGVILLAWWLLPPSVYNRIKDDWNQDFSIFFVSGALVVAGAVLLIREQLPVHFMARHRKPDQGAEHRAHSQVGAVSYPLRFGFRTGLFDSDVCCRDLLRCGHVHDTGGVQQTVGGPREVGRGLRRYGLCPRRPESGAGPLRNQWNPTPS